jgi:UDP-glucose 4-epimerase
MKILLTGANGFIGNYFVDKYKNKYNINTFSFLNDSFESLDLSNIDAIIHLSALVHQMGGASEEEYEKVNVKQTISLANKAKKSGVNKFILMSTVKVYGEETNIKYNENTICKPEDEYGKSKLKAEQLLVKLNNDDFRVSIIRTPIVYGYGVKANIKNLVSLVGKVPILPFARINNRRSMVYIGNLCHLVNEVMIQDKSNLYLASDDNPLSTSELINLIAKGLDKKVILLKIPFFEAVLNRLKSSFHKRLYRSLELDNTITKKRLNLKNPYSVEEGINFMIRGENF